MEGATSIDEFLAGRVNPHYSYVIYRNLGDLYLEKERYQDAAETYEAFVAQDPYHPKAPLLQVEVIEAYKQGGFPSLVLDGKKDFVERYGMDGEFWVRNPRESNTEVARYLKSNLTTWRSTTMLRHKGRRDKRLPGSGKLVSQISCVFPGRSRQRQYQLPAGRNSVRERRFRRLRRRV